MSGCDNPNCSCGSNCSCGKGCNCAYPDLGYLETASTETIITGVAPVKMFYEGSERNYGAENGCKYGANCRYSSCGWQK
ncbi:metallothionein-like protein 1 [Pyrus x bretschneideri]|uniref:metallothionein-like protein 1 n=1 Tax=Pyrus x bretschneideri TaxID=225117 RepID=UPI0005111362|nr:metallothionein-like protein 1 [Pyrus x bretschneideri]